MMTSLEQPLSTTMIYVQYCGHEVFAVTSTSTRITVSDKVIDRQPFVS